jgi:hypothetical protein
MVNNAANPEIHQLYLNSRELRPADLLEISYDVTAHATGMEVALGASLIAEDGTEYWDTAGDTTCILQNGRHSYSRSFRTPDDIPTGQYRLVGALWTPPIGMERLANIVINNAVRIL